jgi:hypothetical protein
VIDVFVKDLFFKFIKIFLCNLLKINIFNIGLKTVFKSITEIIK